MKKSIVILLIAVSIMSSGCQSAEVEPVTIVPSKIEVSPEAKSDVPAKETVKSEETVKPEETAKPEETVESEETAKPEDVAENTEGNIYKEQMDLVYQALSQEWSVDQYFDNQISSLISNHYEGNPLDNVGYALEDLDGDGKEELLISAVSKDASGGMLYDVYTAPDGEVVQVLSGHERNRYYLQWLEEGAYMIANEAANSAFNSAWYYYSMIEGKLELMQGVVFNAAENEENPWFITYDEDWDASNDTHDADGMAQSIIEAYTNSYTTLDYTPFSEYKAD